MLSLRIGLKMSERQGKSCKYLLDTSALYPILISGVPFNVDECAVSSLTEYEVGNVLWRENKQGKLKNPRKVAEIFSEAINPIQKISIDSIADVLTLAIERNLTFYDASYAHIAEKQNLKLVTQDTDLLKKCKSAISIDKMK
jgi:predicted nucleic acid-binding protein